MKKLAKISSILAVSGSLFLGSAQAATIVSAVSGTIDSSGPGFGTLTETFNQAGLLTPYVSGVTDFDAYIATAPEHTFLFPGFEWFSAAGTTSAQVTYDLGSTLLINKLALWNDEFSGIGSLELLTSIDGVVFLSLISGLAPTDHPLDAESYLADVFSFATTSMRYVRLAMSGCPQPEGDGLVDCSIGEVAFSSVSEVPLPAALPLFAASLAGLGFIAKRRRQKAAARLDT